MVASFYQQVGLPFRIESSHHMTLLFASHLVPMLRPVLPKKFFSTTLVSEHQRLRSLFRLGTSKRGKDQLYHS